MMVSNKAIILFCILFALGLSMTGCRKHDDRTSQTTEVKNPEDKNDTVPLGTAGRLLYDNHCSSCHHGDFQNTTLKDRGVQEITTALQIVSSMQKIGPNLSQGDIRELAFALRADTDLISPSVPQGVSAVVMGPNSIALRWTAASDNVGVLGYRIFRDKVMVKELASPELEFLDSNLNPATLYRYEALAFDKAGNVSLTSDVVEGRTSVLKGPDTTAPSVPMGLKGTVLTSSRIKIEWNASTDEVEGSGLKEYQIFRNDSLLATVSPLTVLHLDTNLASGSHYRYQVLSVDNAGNVSAKSSEANVQTTTANGVQIYNARCISCHLGIEVSEVRNFSAAAITSAINTQSQMALLKDLGADEIAALANALSDASDTVKPSTPGGFQGLANSHTSISLSWTASTDSGNSGLKAYKLYRNNTLLNGAIAKTALNYTDNGLTASTTYVYRLLAVDNAGNESIGTANVSIQTPAAPEVPDTTKPTIPTHLSGTPNSHDKISLSWNASTDAGGSGLASYKIFRNSVLITTVSIPSTSFTDQGLIPLTQYRYKVVAVDGAKNESNASTEISVKTNAADGAALYISRNCRTCHGSLADSNLRFRTATVSDFVTLFNGAIRPVAQGGIAEMQGKGINAIELEAIAALLAGEDSGGGNPDTLADYEYRPPTGTRTFVASFFLKTFLNVPAQTTEETTLINLVKIGVGDNAAVFGGSCSRYDADCPQIASNQSVYNEASPTPNFDAAREGYILNLCAQLVETDALVSTALSRAGLTASATASAANVTKSYSLFFPSRTPSQGVVNALVQLHNQSKTKGLSNSKAWQMVLLPMCEWSIGGGI